MARPQPGILAPVPATGRYVVFGIEPGADPRPAVARLRQARLVGGDVVGLGEPLVRALGASVPGLHALGAVAGAGCAFPSTQGALWAFAGGPDPGDSLARLRALRRLLGEGFRLEEDVLAFRHGTGRDLSGYEDGTENPKGEAAAATAVVAGAGRGLDGSSFVAVQRWVHDLGRLEARSPAGRDRLIGRRREDNEELRGAPRSAHVKRTAQEDFEPPAFMVRRSMPWGGVGEHGLYFVAYAASLDPFERALRRMAGLEDGVVDGLLAFSRAVSGGAYWCPPAAGGRLDLRAVGLP
jgi:putative iron-dependent peroxidase